MTTWPATYRPYRARVLRRGCDRARSGGSVVLVKMSVAHCAQWLTELKALTLPSKWVQQVPNHPSNLFSERDRALGNGYQDHKAPWHKRLQFWTSDTEAWCEAALTITRARPRAQSSLSSAQRKPPAKILLLVLYACRSPCRNACSGREVCIDRAGTAGRPA